MELRSTRSRSKTPFEMGAFESGNHVEKTYSRSSKTTVIRSSNEHATSSTDEVTSFVSKPTRRSTRSEKSTKRSLYKTSDYSSEEGENEVSSTKTISQNEKNQLIEDARAASNGNSEVSALELYRKSGRYWDVYPKTDWTYSYHSKDRVELAPGVVAMPNMSRKTIHSVHESEGHSYTDYAHKETNTDSLLSSSSSFGSTQLSYKPRKLFNNNYDDRYMGYQKVSYSSSYWSRTKRSVVSIFTSIFAIFYYAFEVQTSWFAKLHQFTSRVMLFDTWLLQKVNAKNKSSKIALLILLPLLFLGGWWILSTLGSALYGAYLNTTIANSEENKKIVSVETPLDKNDNNIFETSFQGQAGADIVGMNQYESDMTTREFSSAQLASILDYLKDNWNENENKMDTETLVRNILASPNFQNILNDYKTTTYNNLNIITEQNNDVINRIYNEINKLKQDMLDAETNRKEDLSRILTQVQNQNSRKYEQLSLQLKQCCRRSIININNHVQKSLTNLMNDPEFLQNQDGFIRFMRTVFAAKDVLESDLRNLTASLDSKYDSLIAENSRIIMDDVGRKIKMEVTKEISNVHIATGGNTKTDSSSVSSLSETQIKKIVKNVLAIYDADKTGLVDYAMETMGGQILTTRCTENYHYGKAVVSVLGIPLWYPVNSPRTVITPSINPGECWAFQNFPGFVVIQLSNMVEIEAFSLEHISKLLVPDGKIDSAPKEFEVYGLTLENDKEPVKLGTYFYDYDGEPLQFFEVQNRGHVFDIIELRIISNHGNPNYTCLYRFRVHGKLGRENS